ncbi:pnn-1 [Pristionchus pacificus]|nr:pnn-1 [Pristionchus pacificus]
MVSLFSPFKMTDTLQKEIEEAQEKLRSIDGNISALNGRLPGALKRRNPSDIGHDDGKFDNYQRRSMDGRRRESLDNLPVKRTRDDFGDDFEVPKKSLASQVVMPAIETKSRDAAITEMRDKEVKEVKQRNRRLFGSLLVGTLQRFQKDTKKIAIAEKAQAEKVAEVEKRLEDEKRGDKEKERQERVALLNERRDQEKKLKELTRRKALIQYAEEKTNHYKRLQNFIGTRTTPTIFFLPAKHTLQSLELLKNSASTLETLIVARNAELERDLASGEKERDEEEEVKGVKSMVRRRGDDDGMEEDEIDNEKDEEDEGVKCDKNESLVEVRLEGEEEDEDKEGEVEIKLE